MRNVLLITLLTLTLLSPRQSPAAALSHSQFSQIPILHEGRLKPLDSFARSYLLNFSGKDSLKDMSAIEWLAEALFDQDQAYNRELFKITNPDVINSIGLPSRQSHQYSFLEVLWQIKQNATMITALSKIEEGQRSLAQNQLMDLYVKVLWYFDISRSFSLALPKFKIAEEDLAKKLALPLNQPFTYLDIKKHEKYILERSQKIADKKMDKISEKEEDLLRLVYRFKITDEDKKTSLLAIIPSVWQKSNSTYYSPWQILEEGHGSQHSAGYLNLLKDLAVAYEQGSVSKWDSASAKILEISPGDQEAKLELLYNKVKPFNISLALYILSLITLIGYGIKKKELIRKIALLLTSTGAVIHAIGIISRMIIMSRPPVSTLYESIIFVSLIAVLLALLIEKKRKDSTGLIIGAILGSALQFISMKYAAQGDTMGMLVAVLNTNFWLATHVVTITIGYGCCLVGGVLGHIYLIRNALSPKKKQGNLEANIITIALIALFFSLLGTILGGIWADQSWGRFWGWDPKENGALLIVLWLIWVLHGKVTGHINPKGIAYAMVFTNIIVALAWFGVNLLNVGLHSYGFTENIALNLGLFCGAEVLFMAVMYFTPSLLRLFPAQKRVRNGRSLNI